MKTEAQFYVQVRTFKGVNYAVIYDYDEPKFGGQHLYRTVGQFHPEVNWLKDGQRVQVRIDADSPTYDESRVVQVQCPHCKFWH